MRFILFDIKIILSLMPKALAFFCAVGTVLIFGSVFRYSAYGFDFTDEGYYLSWMSDPFLYDGSTTQFGFFHYPIYNFLNGDISAMRRLNIAVTGGLAWIMVYFFLQSISYRQGLEVINQLIISAAIGSSSLILFDSWLLTPSYNSLNLQALLICSIGLILAERTSSAKAIFGWILIGLGGSLAFMAKISTALALAVCVLLYLSLAQKLSFRLLALSILSSILFLVISGLFIDGSLFDFYLRIKLGIELNALLGAGHTLNELIRIDSIFYSWKLFFGTAAGSVGLALAILCIYRGGTGSIVIGILICCTFFLITIVALISDFSLIQNFGKFKGVIVFSIPVAILGVIALLGRWDIFKSLTRREWTLVCIFLAVPHIYAFGTASNYWIVGSSAGLFWILGGLTLLAPLIRQKFEWKIVFPVAFLTQAITALLLQTGFLHPYRQFEPLNRNDTSVSSVRRAASLVLSRDFADFISVVSEVAQSASFVAETPMIDLTGQSPGVLYMMEAKIIGQAWMVGGYPGSSILAETVLKKVSCEEFAAAWVLYEADGPRSISPEVLGNLGASFPEGYQIVGSWRTAEGVGGYPNRRLQYLYKPLSTLQTFSECKRLRDIQK